MPCLLSFFSGHGEAADVGESNATADENESVAERLR